MHDIGTSMRLTFTQHFDAIQLHSYGSENTWKIQHLPTKRMSFSPIVRCIALIQNLNVNLAKYRPKNGIARKNAIAGTVTE